METPNVHKAEGAQLLQPQASFVPPANLSKVVVHKLSKTSATTHRIGRAAACTAFFALALSSGLLALGPTAAGLDVVLLAVHTPASNQTSRLAEQNETPTT